jgi:hypothetical protein
MSSTARPPGRSLRETNQLRSSALVANPAVPAQREITPVRFPLAGPSARAAGSRAISAAAVLVRQPAAVRPLSRRALPCGPAALAAPRGPHRLLRLGRRLRAVVNGAVVSRTHHCERRPTRPYPLTRRVHPVDRRGLELCCRRQRREFRRRDVLRGRRRRIRRERGGSGRCRRRGRCR